MDESTIQQLKSLELDPDKVVEQLPSHLTLSYIDGVLSLYDQENPQSKLNVNFTSGELFHRSQRHLGGEHLIKACQIKGNKNARVLDATCGLGVDSFLLSQAGFEVESYEKHPVVYALLKDGLHRLKEMNASIGFTVYNQDSISIMSQSHVDVVYLDPMFPHRKKTAKNKLGMQLFQDLYQNNADNAHELISQAVKSDCQRVVIKRPTKSRLLTQFKPTFQVKGKTCRFDAYQIS